MRVFMVSLLVSVLATTAAAQQPKPAETQPSPSAAEQAKRPPSYWMEKKLEYSQEILRGLAVDDMKLVAEKAKQMRVLSKAEGWIRKSKPGYKAQLQAFNFANAEIERHARADNLEGAAMGFQQLTISCVSCHAILRNVD